MSIINVGFESFRRPKKVTVEMSIEEAVEVWAMLGTSTTGITLELFEKLSGMFGRHSVHFHSKGLINKENELLEVAESYKLSKTTTYDK